MTLLRMLTFQPDGVAGQAGGGTVAGKPAVEPARTSSKKQAAPVAKQSAAAGTGKWQEPVWADLINQLNISGFNKQLASNCAYLRREGNTVFLSLDQRSESYLTRPRQVALAESLSEHFAEELRVEIAVGGAEAETPTQIEARQETEQLEAARVGLEADPNVKALKDMFGAELVADSVEPISNKSAISQE